MNAATTAMPRVACTPRPRGAAPKAARNTGSFIGPELLPLDRDDLASDFSRWKQVAVDVDVDLSSVEHLLRILVEWTDAPGLRATRGGNRGRDAKERRRGCSSRGRAVEVRNKLNAIQIREGTLGPGVGRTTM